MFIAELVNLCVLDQPPPRTEMCCFYSFWKNRLPWKRPKKFKVKLGTFLFHKFVDIEINKNVHQQNCARARPPYVTKLCKPRLGHFFVDTLWFHIFVGMETNLQNLSRLINATKISDAWRRHHCYKGTVI